MRAVGPPAAVLRPVVDAALAEIVAELSAWAPESALSLFNRAPAGTAVALSSHLRAVLACALDVAAASGGAFDPTIGALTELWGFGPGPARLSPPSGAEVAAARVGQGIDALQFDPELGLAVQPGGLKLDVSSIGKGYAVDLVSERLAAAGAPNALVEIGGELRGEGLKPDGQPWWVAIELPPGAAIAPMSVALHGLAVATSGDYRRVLEHRGRRYAHTLDPRTGAPTTHGLASVTIFHASAMAADAHATAAMVMGPEAGADYIARQGLAALMVTRRGAGWCEHLSPALTAMLD